VRLVATQYIPGIGYIRTGYVFQVLARSQFPPEPLAQRAIQEGQASLHPVVDRGVRIVELLVNVRHAVLGQPLGEQSAAVVDAVLIAPAAIDEDAA
jgi:hypothetical protein